MRISPDRRRRRPAARERSRFGRGSSAAGRNLIRFRRNREAFWREITTVVLWGAITLMLFNLAGTLDRFSERHLADRALALRWAFPALAVGAAGFCVWRVRNGVVEILDIRREQRLLEEQLASDDPDEDVPVS